MLKLFTSFGLMLHKIMILWNIHYIHVIKYVVAIKNDSLLIFTWHKVCSYLHDKWFLNFRNKIKITSVYLLQSQIFPSFSLLLQTCEALQKSDGKSSEKQGQRKCYYWKRLYQNRDHGRIHGWRSQINIEKKW